MSESEFQLVDCIYQTFDGITLNDGFTLHEALAMDSYDYDHEIYGDLIAQDERFEWSRIKHDLLLDNNSIWSFFDAEGFRFHLPAIMALEIYYPDNATAGYDSIQWKFEGLIPQQGLVFHKVTAPNLFTRLQLSTILKFYKWKLSYVHPMERDEVQTVVDKIQSYMVTV